MSKQDIRPQGAEGISTPPNIQQVAPSGKTPTLSPSEIANALGRAAEALRRAGSLFSVINLVGIGAEITGQEAESAQKWAELAEKSVGGGAA